MDNVYKALNSTAISTSSMELSTYHHLHHFISIPKPPNPTKLKTLIRPIFSLSTNSLQSETLKTLEWPSLCNQLSCFTSTTMGLTTTQNAQIPLGQTLDETRKLLEQTSSALSFMAEEESGQQLGLSRIEDVSRVLEAAGNGELLTVGEICRVRRMLREARSVMEKLEEVAGRNGERSRRYSPLIVILNDCDFEIGLDRKIGYCVDCDLSIILDRASEDLEIIRSERRKNMDELEGLLKEVSNRVYQAGGIDRPLITERRSRMCVGIKASHRHLLPDGIILSASSSGATYFMEPSEAVELNNMEVRLANAEKDEEITILSLLTSEIAQSGLKIRYMLKKVLELDLAFARAAHAKWMHGVLPIIGLGGSESSSSVGEDHVFSIDIEGIQHPLLLESSLSKRSLLKAYNKSHHLNLAGLDKSNDTLKNRNDSEDRIEFPVPIDIKIIGGTRVVVISGPNTGGKTASMKTLGLASLMSKAGMYLPAKNLPRVPWFDLVLADIGDHQSLEQNLSTFSGHISRISKIMEVASKESLVLMDEIGSGTDPSEGVALSASILQYLKSRVHLAVVTTHYADLTLLKEKDSCFENAAMEFSHKTLQPTYQILWGSTGDSNALNIAVSIGFDNNVIENAKQWVKKLRPEKQQERWGLLYQSLMEERNRLEAQVREAASVHSAIMKIYNEIQSEAEDLDAREKVLMTKETQYIQQELSDAEMQIENLIQNLEKQLRNAKPDQFNSLVRQCNSAISSVIEAHQPSELLVDKEKEYVAYVPQYGEQVYVKKLGSKLVTVVEEPGEDDTVLVQFGKVKVRVNKSDIRASATATSGQNSFSGSVPRMRRKVKLSKELWDPTETNKGGGISYGPLVQTSTNTVDLRGMRVEEAALELDMAISSRGSNSVLFIIHGMGTGAVKERTLEILQNHPRVVKYDQESPLNFGCTVAYIN